MSESQPIEIKYSSYTPAQRKASEQYRLKNKDKINAQRKLYYQQKKLADPIYALSKKYKAKEYYELKKMKGVIKDIIDLYSDEEEFPPEANQLMNRLIMHMLSIEDKYKKIQDDLYKKQNEEPKEEPKEETKKEIKEEPKQEEIKIELPTPEIKTEPIELLEVLKPRNKRVPKQKK
jgi:hypothetical protein